MRMFMIVAAAMLMAAHVSADGVTNTKQAPASLQVTTPDNDDFKFHISLNEMNSAMHLDTDQLELLQIFNRDLTRRIARLKHTPSEERRAKLACIVSQNMHTVREVVSDDQFHTYLNLLNKEINASGLNTILYSAK